MNYCPHCFFENPDTARHCKKCGNIIHLQNRKNHLPVMSILIGRYLIGETLGVGGFGITYAGYDLRLRKCVAVKEYYPNGLCTRISSYSHQVELSSTDAADFMEKGKKKFLMEAQTMSRFNHLPTVVDVLDFFETNGTAYIVMEYLDGVSLSAWLESHGPERNFNTLYAMLCPVMIDLAKIHQATLIHRDISPSNLMLLKNGSVKLLDFGTAREISEEGERSLSVVLKHGYAPPEQYSRKGQQGAWTDVYALCATIYKLLTDVRPDAATDRQNADTLKPPSQLGATISKTQEQTLLRGLALKRSERIQTLAELMEGFDEQTVTNSPPPPPSPPWRWIIGAVALTAVVAVVSVVAVLAVLLPDRGSVSAAVSTYAPATLETSPPTPTPTAKPAPQPTPKPAAKPTPQPTPDPQQLAYEKAEALSAEGRYTEAIAAFEALGGYKDNSEIILKLKIKERLHTAKIGEFVTFGTYEQDNNSFTSAEDIQWRVLAKEGNRILVISKYALDARAYNTKYTTVSWETCALRSWLNDEFYHAAFTPEEQALIPTTMVIAHKNPSPSFNSDSGNDTPDKVFLLSIQEAEQYFTSDEARKCVPTDYAKAQGAGKSNNNKTASGEATCWWWLRTPGKNQYSASDVYYNGSISRSGGNVNLRGGCVRPAIWIDLDA